MIKSDLTGVALVYIYVAVLLIITEKLLSKYPSASRKVLHIMEVEKFFILWLVMLLLFYQFLKQKK